MRPFMCNCGNKLKVGFLQRLEAVYVSIRNQTSFRFSHTLSQEMIEVGFDCGRIKSFCVLLMLSSASYGLPLALRLLTLLFASIVYVLALWMGFHAENGSDCRNEGLD